jgi:hypothetical protein
MSSFMESELERLARVAVSHGLDDPAIDVFLVFVGSLDLLPDAATLKPAAQRIGKPRLAEALDRPGEPRLGACRLLAAALAEVPRPVAPPRDQRVVEPPTEVGLVDRPGGGTPGAVTEERPVATRHRIPDLFESLLKAIRVALHSFA